MNSSITVSTSDGDPDLSITSLFNNGTNVKASCAVLNGVSPSALSFWLYPVNLQFNSSSRSGPKIAFRAVFQDANAFEESGNPTCVTWTGNDALTYGSIVLDQFVFSLDNDGQAEKLEILAL